MIIRTTKRADAVLAVIEVLLNDGKNLYAEPYQNGREHGWSLINCFGLQAAFSEARNSDEIVVYIGASSDFDMGGNIPNEEIYTYKKFFRCDDIGGAARYVLEYLLEEGT